MRREMDREILFRGKKKGENWIYGFLCTGDFSMGEPEKTYIFELHDGTFFGGEIDAETACEYTGLSDDNKVKIFENDILKLYDKNTDSAWLARVEFGNPHGEYTWGWNLVPLTHYDGNTDILLWIDMPGTTCEVIGNMIDDWNTKGDIERMMAKMKEV